MLEDKDNKNIYFEPRKDRITTIDYNLIKATYSGKTNNRNKERDD